MHLSVPVLIQPFVDSRAAVEPMEAFPKTSSRVSSLGKRSAVTLSHPLVPREAGKGRHGRFDQWLGIRSSNTQFTKTTGHGGH